MHAVYSVAMKTGREPGGSFETVANMHMHTPYSDGEWFHADIAAAAARAGVDVIVVTDHNVLVRGLDGYLGKTLVLTGEEVHDPLRHPQASHCLVYGAGEELAPLAPQPQALIDGANERGGMAFLAHPFEVASPISMDAMAIPWDDWRVKRYRGIELWNCMSDFKASLKNWPLAVFFAFFPSWAIRGPFGQTVRKWDELLASGQKVVAIGNADAHGTPYHLGPISRPVLAYEYLFRCVNTHVLLSKPLSGNVVADRKLFLEAVGEGRCFIGYDRSASSRGFSFTATSGATTASMGETLARSSATRFRIKAPAPAQLRLLRDGNVVARGTGRILEWMDTSPGVYRAEASRFFRLANRPWIFSNPIYVR